MAVKETKVSSLKPGQYIQPKTFRRKAGVEVRGAFVVVQLANGVDERYELTDVVNVVTGADKK